MPKMVHLCCTICKTDFQRQFSVWKRKYEKGQRRVFCSHECSAVGTTQRRRIEAAVKQHKRAINRETFDRDNFDPYAYFLENWDYTWLEKRLNKVDEAPCWIWTGTYHCGYPAYRVRHKETGKTFNLRMRKVFAGETTQRVYTTCDNMACVNPEHLYS